jgi:hypothetical protein
VILKTSVGPLVELIDLREDPSIGSETLGFQDGWPHDPHVRAWFLGAMRFLARARPTAALGSRPVGASTSRPSARSS